MQEQDIARVMALTGHFVTEEVTEDEEPPCPACGTSAPLVDGACSDCGIQLA